MAVIRTACVGAVVGALAMSAAHLLGWALVCFGMWKMIPISLGLARLFAALGAILGFIFGTLHSVDAEKSA